MSQETLHPHASAFHALFEGFTQAYGVYSIGKAKANDKGKVKGSAASFIGEVTDQLWSDHLNGKQGLGIIPINENNLCRFGAIDVDNYKSDPSSLQMKVQKFGLPLVVCRTKSGGAHLYCFTTDWVEASLMKERLFAFASILGVGNSEIFPKQSELLVERGDAGSWINMPYFGGNNTERYAYGFNGMVLKTVEDFLRWAQDKMIDPETLISMETEMKEPLGPDAPPCLNCLCAQGFPEGTRNNGLMNLGVLLMMENPDGWTSQLDDYNNQFMTPPLPSEEVLGVIKSLKRKDYNYMCKQQPLVQYCNRSKCRTVKYGIGPSTGMPAMGTLTKFDSEPPIWFVDVEGGGRLELLTEDLQNPLRFQKACMDQLNMMPPIMKRVDWSELISNMLDSVNIVKVSREMTPEGLFEEHFHDFLNIRSNYKENTDSRDVLLVNKVWVYEERFYFRIKDLMEYLQSKRFLDFKQNKVSSLIREWGATHHFFNIGGRGVNCFSIPITGAQQTTPFIVPDQTSDEII